MQVTLRSRLGVGVFVVMLGCDKGTGPDRVVSLRIEPDPLYTIVETKTGLSVLVVRANGTSARIAARAARYTSANEQVARMSSDSAGLVISTGVGQTEITVAADVDGRTHSAKLQVVVGNVIP
jgi:hypothetical protein